MRPKIWSPVMPFHLSVVRERLILRRIPFPHQLLWELATTREVNKGEGNTPNLSYHPFHSLRSIEKLEDGIGEVRTKGGARARRLRSLFQLKRRRVTLLELKPLSHLIYG